MIERTWQNTSSFLFGGQDMFQRFGLQLVDDGMPSDVLMPDLRERKVTIPLRSGAYDYGAHYYDERTITYTCVTTRMVSRDDAREIAYILSKKAEIRIWTEPDKHYIGRVYQAPSLEQLRNIGNRFPLTFVCEPFAYGATTTEPMPSLVFQPDYKGTAPTPTYIVIENTGSGDAVNIQIVQTNRKDSL